MVVIRYFMGLVALFLTSFAVVSATPSQAQTDAVALRPTTPISEVHFRGGYFDQDKTQFGRWYEKRNNGKINYEFFETASDGKVIELTGPKGLVKMKLDLNAKIIQGEWPGQAMRTIYKINGIKPMVFKDPPVVAPPVVTPPVITPPSPPVANPQAPRPRDLQFVSHTRGHFARTSGMMWEERATGGQGFPFTEIGHDDRSLYLYDEGRDVLITLEPKDMQSRVSIGGEPLRRLYALTGFAQPPQTPIPHTPIPTQPDNRSLSEAEKMACTRRGGFVERAGLLGAERCTIPYSDGGDVCTDSSQCQGQCRSNSDAPTGAPASGLCQPTDNPFGCHSEILGGRVAPGLCVD